MLLTHEELIAVTGKKRPSAQIRALQTMRIPHRVRPNGTPMVIEADLTLTGNQREGRAPPPDYDAL